MNSEPRLIAEAIAAFYQNNLRRQAAGRPTVDSQTFPCIIMVDTAPIFYLITFTMELVQCVQVGKCPPRTTIVQRCIPPVPNPGDYSQDGLVPPANRGIVFQCFQAFKAFVVSLVQCRYLTVYQLKILLFRGNVKRLWND